MRNAVKTHKLTTLSAQQRANLLRRTESDIAHIVDSVKPIVADVKQRGDDALAEFAHKFDKADISAGQIQVTPQEFDDAFEQVDDEVIDTLRYAVDNVRRFHEAQMPEEMWLKEIRPGAFAGDRYTPINAVACYVPRGKGSFPSVAIMTTVPAVVAGVPTAVIITPPGPDGSVDAATLVVARLVGIDKVYKCGGAQGVAAVAYGTDTVPRCDKIVGPGSPYVVAAKRLVADVLDPGTPAGPSESIVLADSSANPRLAALDLLIEAEHGPDSSAFLVTDNEQLATEAAQAIEEYWGQMSELRVDYSSTVLGGDSGGIVLAESWQDAVQFCNDYAAEHLLILSKDPFKHLSSIKNAGEILLGEYTPISIANFVLGPNAVLPTSMAAKTASPLSVFDYMKSCSVGYVTEQGYREMAPHTHRFAKYEGFDAHANAVSHLRDEAFDSEN
ncbi:histidinol dehydrogenase [Porticoccus sp. GXU_MW_L64]